MKPVDRKMRAARVFPVPSTYWCRNVNYLRRDQRKLIDFMAFISNQSRCAEGGSIVEWAAPLCFKTSALIQTATGPALSITAAHFPIERSFRSWCKNLGRRIRLSLRSARE